MALPSLGLAALTLSCAGDRPSPVELEVPFVANSQFATEAAATAAEAGTKKRERAVLIVDDMLADPIFMESVEEVQEPGLRAPLLAALEALAEGNPGKAKGLIRRATDEADAMLSRGSADGSSIAWSIIERYLDEAELTPNHPESLDPTD